MKKWNDDDNIESHRASNNTTTSNGGMNLGKESLQDDNFPNSASVIEENKNFNVTLTPLVNGADFKLDEKATKNEVIEV
jgi:hypothetical protein